MERRENRGPVVIMGAARRDFHDFNAIYRGEPQSEVAAFTATQNPQIAGRRYPPELSGPLYPEGTPIMDQGELTAPCRSQHVDQAVFAHSDRRPADAICKGSIAVTAGEDFLLLGPDHAGGESPLIAIRSVLRGAGRFRLDHGKYARNLHLQIAGRKRCA